MAETVQPLGLTDLSIGQPRGSQSVALECRCRPAQSVNHSIDPFIDIRRGPITPHHNFGVTGFRRPDRTHPYVIVDRESVQSYGQASRNLRRQTR